MILTQSLVNGVIRGGELALLAIGLTMIYGILKFANFSHTEFATLGAYLAFMLTTTLRINIFFSAPIAVMLTGLVAVIVDKLTFKKLRQAGSVSLMVLSIGLSICFRSSIQSIWGAQIRGYPIDIFRGMEFLGIRITPIQITILIVALVCMLIFHLLLIKTRIGKAMRATSDNLILAQASGINTDGVIMWVWFIGASFAAIGGILIGLETQLRPNMGFAILLPVFATAILGGIGSVYGAMMGGMILGIVENIGISFDFGILINIVGISRPEGIYISPSYKPAISFAILIIILLVRPGGIFGKRGDREG